MIFERRPAVRRRSPSSVPPAEWPLCLRHVIRAVEIECPNGHAGALTELSELAFLKVPARGILDPTFRGEQEIFALVEAIARRHLGLTSARNAWQGALGAAKLDLETRDNIEQAALQVQAVSDTAYYYAGLAFGLAAMSLYRLR